MSQSGCKNSPNQTPTNALQNNAGHGSPGVRPEINRGAHQVEWRRAISGFHAVGHAVDEPAIEMYAKRPFERLAISRVRATRPQGRAPRTQAWTGYPLSRRPRLAPAGGDDNRRKTAQLSSVEPCRRHAPTTACCTWEQPSTADSNSRTVSSRRSQPACGCRVRSSSDHCHARRGMLHLNSSFAMRTVEDSRR